MTNTDRVDIYGPRYTHVAEVQADSALMALRSVTPVQRFASLTRRWQYSPVASDRDNCYAQLDKEGTRGYAVRRADTDTGAAEHRNNVVVCRAAVARGRTLADMQTNGAYADVTPADMVGG